MFDELIKFYKASRIKDCDIYDVEYLDNLFVKDIKQLYFIVFYYYLIKAEVPDNVKMCNSVCVMVDTLVSSIHDEELKEYYTSQFGSKEVGGQWNRVYGELKIFERRKKICEQLGIDFDNSDNES